MRKITFFKIILTGLVFIMFHACVEDHEENTFAAFYENNLNEQGKRFINTIQTDPQWEKNWHMVEKAGTPMPNEAICAFSPGHGTYLALPIENKGEVTHVAFYPLNDKNSETKIEAPVIVGEKQTKRPEFAKSFFAARSHTIWEKKKMTVSRGLKQAKYNRPDSVAVTRSLERVATNNVSINFFADIWLYYEYVPNGISIESSEYRKQEILYAFQQGLTNAKNLISGIQYNYPYFGYSINITVSNSASEEEAEQKAIQFLHIACRPIRALFFVDRVWCVYQWEPIGNSFPEGTGGGFPEEDKKRCPTCLHLLPSCTCPDIVFQVLFNNDLYADFFELLEPYHIQVYIAGKKADQADFAMIQMAKHGAPQDWRSLGYGAITNNTYHIVRTSFNPGTWSLRVACSLEDGSMHYSDEFVIEERWPSIDKFKDNLVILNFLEGLWDKSVAFAEANKSTYAVREFGAFIFYNPDGSYSCVEVEPGPIVHLNQEGVHGSMEFVEADYANLSDWGNPNRQIPLVVGTMHAHYPLTWAKSGLEVSVGPSSGDNSPNQVWPGLVYDYTKNIKAENPVINPLNPFKVWIYGPPYRTTL